MTAGGDARGGPRAGEERHEGREAALEMLYQWEVGGAPIDEVLDSYRDVSTHPPMPDRMREFAERLARGTVAHRDEIDPIVTASAEHWRLERMAVIDRAIIRLAVYEFLHEKTTPPKVVINEAIELAKTFSTDDAVKFVNGVLDAIRKRLEAGEP